MTEGKCSQQSASESEHPAVEGREGDAADLGRLHPVREQAQHLHPSIDNQQRLHLDGHRLRLLLLLLRGGDPHLRLLLLLLCDGDGRDVEGCGHVLGAPPVDEARWDVDGAELPAGVGHAERAVEVRERGAVGVAHRRCLLEGEGDGAVGGGEGGQAHRRHRDVGGRGRNSRNSAAPAPPADSTRNAVAARHDASAEDDLFLVGRRRGCSAAAGYACCGGPLPGAVGAGWSEDDLGRGRSAYGGLGEGRSGGGARLCPAPGGSLGGGGLKKG